MVAERLQHRSPEHSLIASLCHTEKADPSCPKRAPFCDFHKTSFLLAAALWLAQQNRAGSMGQGLGPGETHAAAYGGKENEPQGP